MNKNLSFYDDLNTLPVSLDAKNKAIELHQPKQPFCEMQWLVDQIASVGKIKSNRKMQLKVSDDKEKAS